MPIPKTHFLDLVFLKDHRLGFSERNNFLYTSWFSGWSKNKIDIDRLTDQNLIAYIYTGAPQRQ